MAKDLTGKVKELVKNPKRIRNIGIVAHIDHGKTTLTDNLVARAGMISEELAGKVVWTDFDEQEQERGITIFSSNVSMVHEFKEDDYLINLIDTPGHVDFGGDVTRAMRAVDGVILLVDAVEGIMPQSETVLRQALKERVRPVLFINKVDRLIRELKATPEQMQEKFMKIIAQVNGLISKYAEKQYKEKWKVKVDDGSVAFGSGYRNWAMSFPYMKRTGVSFEDVINLTNDDKEKELAKKADVADVLLDMVVRHLPDPKVAQEYRIPKIWPGDKEAEISKHMVSCDPEGPLAGVITKVYPDPHVGFIASARLFSGVIKNGQDVKLAGQGKTQRLQQLGLYKGNQRIKMDSVPAGNIVALVGLGDAFSGETICAPSVDMTSFEDIKHIFEPVVTKSIEPKNTKDLTKFIEFLRQVNREDPTLEVNINQETGEYLVKGLGELHIEAKIERKLKEKEIDIDASPPIVVYRESVKKKSPEIEGKSPNKHNRFIFSVEPMNENLHKAMVDGHIGDVDVKKKDKDLAQKLEEYGMDYEDAKSVKMIYEKNILLDDTKGIQYLNEAMELVKDGFKDVMNEGPLAKEPCAGVVVRLTDASLHEDAIHRGPAQVLPAVRGAIKNAMMHGEAIFWEPRQVIRIDSPTDQMGGALSEVQNRRGQVEEMEEEDGTTVIKANIPIAEAFGFDGALKSATGGKGFYSLIDVKFETLPSDLHQVVLKQVRDRKGLKEASAE